MSTADTRLPYPGLRSFRREETDLFFGRETSVNDMIAKLADGRFLAVLGASGSGKSSLVRTGLLDGLELGLLAGKSWWRIIDTHPGGAPMRNLARALCGTDWHRDEIEAMAAFLSRGPRSIAEWCQDGHLEDGENLLILVDQFEELFRYQHYEGRQEAEAFVALLLESARVPGLPVYVVLTMRSEFLGACALIAGLAEAMNRGQYLTPRMSREQCHDAIEGPARVCGFAIAPELTNRLLNDLADFAPWDEDAERGRDQTNQLERMARRADQLPLLQHALNRLWIRAATKDGPVRLELADYEALGGLSGALNAHAHEILAELGADRARVAESVFRALTVGTSIADAVRRPTRFSELVAISGAPASEVRAVCDAFRAQGRNFLTPFAPVPLEDQAIVDISHESLIRQWSDLSTWLEKEAQDADAIRRLGVAAARAGTGKGDLLYGRDLSNLDDWRRGSKLTEAWARRYVDDPKGAFTFLDRSLSEDRSRKSWEWRRKAALWFFGLIVPAMIFFASYIVKQNMDLTKTVFERDAAQKDLLEKNADLLAAKTELEANTIALVEADAAREQASLELKRYYDETVATIQSYIGKKADEMQRSGDYGKSGDLLAALVAKTRGDGMKADDRVVGHFAARFAWQLAAVRAGATSTDDARPRGTKMKVVDIASDGGARRSHALWRDESDKTLIRVVERRTGRVSNVFRHDGAQLGELSAEGDHFLSPDGKRVLLVGDNGRLFRWEAGKADSRRVLDRRWINKRKAKSAAFADDGRIAVIYEEFETDFLTIIPLDHAWEAPSWPTHRIIADLRQASREVHIEPTAISVVPKDDRPPTPVLRAIVEKSLVLELPKRIGTDWSRGLARFDLESRTARWLVAPSIFSRSTSTASPKIVGVDVRVPTATCSVGLNESSLATMEAEFLELKGHGDDVKSAAFSPDGRRVVTASDDNTARLWDSASGAETAVLEGHEATVWSAAFSPDGHRLVTASDDNTARLWDSASGAEITVLKGPGGTVRSAGFSPDGRRVAAASEYTARLWDSASGAEIAVLRHQATVWSAAFSPDGRRVVTGSDDNTARLWDSASGAVIAVLRGHEGAVRSAAFSPDGRRVVTASDDNTARLWDSASGAAIAVLKEHGDDVRSATFSPDGHRVVTASLDNTARLWDSASGAEIAVLRGHEGFGGVWSAAFSPDGRRVVTASSDDTARIWNHAESPAGSAAGCSFEYDIENGKISSAAYSLPIKLADSYTLSPALGGGLGPVFSSEQRPSWRMGPTASTATGGSLTELAWWGTSGVEFNPPTGKSHGTESFLIAGYQDNSFHVLDSSSAHFGTGANGRAIETRSFALADLSPIEAVEGGDFVYTTDGSGELFVDVRGGRWFVQQFSRSQSVLVEAALRDATGTCQPDNLRRAPRERVKSRLLLDITQLQAASAESNTVIALLQDGRPAIVTFKIGSDGKKVEADAYCGGFEASEILDVSYGDGRALLRGKSGEDLAVLEFRDSGAQAGLGIRTTIKIDPSDGVSKAVLLPNDRIAIFDASGAMAIHAPATGLSLSMAAFLPGFEKLEVNGDSILLLRSESVRAPEKTSASFTDALVDGLSETPSGAWTSAVLVDAKGSNARPAITHTGFLPLALSEIAMARPRHDGGIDVVANGFAYRFNLPPADSPDKLVDGIEAAGLAANSRSFQEGELVDLGATAMTAGRQGEAEWGNDYRVCATALEVALDAFEGEREGRDALFREAEAACGTSHDGQPSMPAMLALISGSGEGLTSAEETWPVAASKALASAADGDLTALRVLLSWGMRRAPSDSMLARGTSMLLDSLFEKPASDGTSVGLPDKFAASLQLAADRPDPFVQRALGYLHGEGSESDRAKAFRHYWLAERLFHEAKQPGPAEQVSRRRLALATELPQEVLIAETHNILAWKPASRPQTATATVPISRPERLLADIDQIDRLAVKIGSSAALDLVALHLLSLAEESPAGAGSDQVRRRIVSRLLARHDWPPVSGQTPSALASLFERAANFLPTADADRVSLRYRTIELLEASDPLLDFTVTEDQAPARIYRRALVELAHMGPAMPRAPIDDLKLGERAFSYSSVQVRDAAALYALQLSLLSRKQLAKRLVNEPKHQRAVAYTEFWTAVAYEGLNTSATHNSLDSCLAEFKGIGDQFSTASNDLKAIFVKASYQAMSRDRKRQNGDYRTVLSILPDLLGQVEKSNWSPIWSNEFASDSQSFIDRLGFYLMRAEIPEPEFSTIDTIQLTADMESLDLSRLYDSTHVRGRTTQASDDALAKGTPTLIGSYAVSYSAGRARNHRGTMTDLCAILTSSRFDPMRISPAVPFERIRMPVATTACQEELNRSPDNPRLKFSLARAFNRNTDAKSKEQSTELYLSAAAEGYTATFNNLTVDATGDTRKQLAGAYIQRVFRDHFADAIRGFETLAPELQRREAMRYLTQRAADLGSVEANLRLAADPTLDPVERRFRLRVAREKLNAPETLLTQLGELLPLSPDDERLVQKRVEAWEPEKLIELPPNLKDIILGNTR